jgi:hypothetical protein
MSEQSPPPTTPPGTLSPDGNYRWDGSQWRPVPLPPPPPPPAASPLPPTAPTPTESQSSAEAPTPESQPPPESEPRVAAEPLIPLPGEAERKRKSNRGCRILVIGVLGLIVLIIFLAVTVGGYRP